MSDHDPGQTPGSSRLRRLSRRQRAWALAAIVVVTVTLVAVGTPAALRLLGRLQGPGPWPPPPRSGVEVIAIDSQALGRAMPALVWMPAGTTPHDRLPLVVLFHGQGANAAAWFHGIGADELAERLIAEGRIPPVILVSAGIDDSMGIDSEPVEERYDHGPYGTYLADELIPALVDRYPVSTDPRDHHVAGLSMGGYAALHLAFRHPDRVGGVGALSPAVALAIQEPRAWLYRDEADRDAHDPQRLATTAPLGDLRVFLGHGAADYGWIVEGTRVMADVLAERGVAVRLGEPPPTGHENGTWHALTPSMLEWLLGPESGG
jgi:enterochelin esterase-like enzyme